MTPQTRLELDEMVLVDPAPMLMSVNPMVLPLQLMSVSVMVDAVRFLTTNEPEVVPMAYSVIARGLVPNQ